MYIIKKNGRGMTKMSEGKIIKIGNLVIKRRGGEVAIAEQIFTDRYGATYFIDKEELLKAIAELWNNGDEGLELENEEKK